ncbi:acyl-CoA dehydrogenase family protein [Pseudomonas aeruginosa]|nr:acyl-CoA dehydrogenase family protein [Pseudomonas aeruginosa]
MIRKPWNLLLDSIRQFVRESLVPHEQEVAETDRIPEAIIARMREMGLFGLSIPEAYGGLGVTMEEEVSIAFELGRTLAGVPFAAGHQQWHRLPGHRHRRHRRTEAALPAAPGVGRTAQFVLASPNRTPVPTPPR